MEILELTGSPQDLAGENLEGLRRYCALLHRANQTVRLAGPRDEETLWEDHVLDCLYLLPLLPSRGEVLDLGTGGGLPGAVLALCRPDLSFTLADSLSRKTAALEAIVRQLGLQNAGVICCRSEDLALQRREAFQCSLVRAVSEAGVIAEYLAPLTAQGGTVLAMKGPAWEEETAPLAGRWQELGLSEPKAWHYCLAGRHRFVIQWDKIGPCPPAYPRRPGRAEKKLWWR